MLVASGEILTGSCAITASFAVLHPAGTRPTARLRADADSATRGRRRSGRGRPGGSHHPSARHGVRAGGVHPARPRTGRGRPGTATEPYGSRADGDGVAGGGLSDAGGPPGLRVAPPSVLCTFLLGGPVSVTLLSVWELCTRSDARRTCNRRSAACSCRGVVVGGGSPGSDHAKASCLSRALELPAAASCPPQ